jgi:hypothetical protein
MFENIVMRAIFGSTRNAVTGEWEKTHKEKIHNLHSFSNYDDDCYSATSTTTTILLLLLLLLLPLLPLPLPPLQLPPPLLLLEKERKRRDGE